MKKMTKQEYDLKWDDNLNEGYDRLEKVSLKSLFPDWLDSENERLFKQEIIDILFKDKSVKLPNLPF